MDLCELILFPCYCNNYNFKLVVITNNEMIHEMNHICILNCGYEIKWLWSLQLWTQFHGEAWKIQDFNRVLTHDLATLVWCSNQMSYETTDDQSQCRPWIVSIAARMIAIISAVQNMVRFICHFIVDSFIMGTFEPRNDQLPTSVAS